MGPRHGVPRRSLQRTHAIAIKPVTVILAVVARGGHWHQIEVQEWPDKNAFRR